jgi:NADH-ubiquinone/plastoquinone oxidoreductase, chain 3
MLVHLGGYGFVEMVIFVSILVVGLIYAWMKVALTWVSGSSSTRVASAVVAPIRAIPCAGRRSATRLPGAVGGKELACGTHCKASARNPLLPERS